MEPAVAALWPEFTAFADALWTRWIGERPHLSDQTLATRLLGSWNPGWVFDDRDRRHSDFAKVYHPAAETWWLERGFSLTWVDRYRSEFTLQPV